MSRTAEDIEARDIIARKVHAALVETSEGCNHNPGYSGWTGASYAIECDQVAQEAIEALEAEGYAVIGSPRPGPMEAAS